MGEVDYEFYPYKLGHGVAGSFEVPGKSNPGAS